MNKVLNAIEKNCSLTTLQIVCSDTPTFQSCQFSVFQNLTTISLTLHHSGGGEQGLPWSWNEILAAFLGSFPKLNNLSFKSQDSSLDLGLLLKTIDLYPTKLTLSGIDLNVSNAPQALDHFTYLKELTIDDGFFPNTLRIVRGRHDLLWTTFAEGKLACFTKQTIVLPTMPFLESLHMQTCLTHLSFYTIEDPICTQFFFESCLPSLKDTLLDFKVKRSNLTTGTDYQWCLTKQSADAFLQCQQLTCLQLLVCNERLGAGISIPGIIVSYISYACHY